MPYIRKKKYLFNNFQRLFDTYGPIFRIWHNPISLSVFVVDPDVVEYFLSSNVHIKKSDGYDLLQPWLGQGLINNSGEIWRKHRKILTPAFHMKILEQFCDSFHKYGRTLVEKLKTRQHKSIDIYKYVILYAMDAICDSSMRIDVNAQITEDTTYVDARKQERRINNTEEGIDEFGRKRRKKVFLDILLDSNSMSDDEIREEVDTFLFGGHDTVASTISFGLFELAKHPAIQAKIFEEIEFIVGVDKSKLITINHLNQMDYLDRVMKEILRLYPAAPLIERELEEDILLNGCRYPKGTTISFHIFIQHRCQRLFPEPERFDPDRFLPENVASRHKFAYIPFSAGPRNCIGQKYALINSKITIANIVRHFILQSVVPEHKIIFHNDAVLKSTNGLPIKLVCRT
ncbi:hypothetical protein Trydic_g694 [Trypoxylus dichotomus]